MRQQPEPADEPRGRRAPGELEAEILAILWASPTPLTARAVQKSHGGTLAATTVLTILGRLERKAAIKRHPAGRGFAYEALVAPAELTARRMRALLAVDDDHDAVLQQFVGSLPAGDEARLRSLLATARRRRS